MTFNLVCQTTATIKNKNTVDSHDLAFHFNPRLNENVIVRNTYQNGQWGEEEREGGNSLRKGSNFTLTIICEDKGFEVFIDEVKYTFYCHRIPPDGITHLRVKGLMTLCSVLYKSPNVSKLSLEFSLILAMIYLPIR